MGAKVSKQGVSDAQLNSMIGKLSAANIANSEEWGAAVKSVTNDLAQAIGVQAVQARQQVEAMARTIAQNTDRMAGAIENVTAEQVRAMIAASEANARVQIKQSDNQKEILKSMNQAELQKSLAQIEKDVNIAALNSEERNKLAILNSQERLDMEKLSAQERSHQLQNYSKSMAHMAAIQQELALNNQENMLRLSNQSGRDMKEIMAMSIEAQSRQARANQMAAEAAQEAAAENTIKALGMALGPNGVQGIMGTQNDVLQNQQQQFNRMIMEQTKAMTAMSMEAEANRAKRENEISESHHQSVLEMANRLKEESARNMKLLDRVTELQQRKPEILERPSSEILSALAAEVVVKTSQECKADFKADMKIRITGTGLSVRNNKMIQKNKVDVTCMQETTNVANIQNTMKDVMKEFMSIQRKGVHDTMGMSDYQINNKIESDVNNKFTTETVQNLANSANAAMDIEFAGKDNLIEGNVFEQANEIVLSTTQNEIRKMDIMQSVERDVDKLVQVEEIGISENAIIAIVGGVVAVVAIIGLIAYFATKGNSSYDGDNDDDEDEYVEYDE